MRSKTTEPAPLTEPPAEPPTGKKRKRPPTGGSFEAGNNANPHGRAGKPEEPDPQGGVVTAARMRKVLGQGKAADEGTVEKWLRAWLQKNPAAYLEAIEKRAKAESDDTAVREENAALRAAVERLTAELADLRERPAPEDEDDPGTDAALDLTTKLQDMLAGAGADVGPDGRCRGCGQKVAAGAVGPA